MFVKNGTFWYAGDGHWTNNVQHRLQFEYYQHAKSIADQWPNAYVCDSDGNPYIAYTD